MGNTVIPVALPKLYTSVDPTVHQRSILHQHPAHHLGLHSGYHPRSLHHSEVLSEGSKRSPLLYHRLPPQPARTDPTSFPKLDIPPPPFDSPNMLQQTSIKVGSCETQNDQ